MHVRVQPNIKVLLPGSLITDNKTTSKEASSSIVPQLIGTWNTVNETNGNMGNTHMNNMVGTSGKITFYVNGWEGLLRLEQSNSQHNHLSTAISEPSRILELQDRLKEWLQELR